MPFLEMVCHKTRQHVPFMAFHGCCLQGQLHAAFGGAAVLSFVQHEQSQAAHVHSGPGAATGLCLI